jgi:transcription elongation GreA/GreB family factor
MYHFLPKDYQKLLDQIEKLRGRVKEIGKEMGESCREGAETFHENFAYEDGERQQAMWSQRFRELIRIKERAVIVNMDTKHPNKVTIGKNVTVRDESDAEETYHIGSYLTFEDSNSIPYNSPLAKLLIGAKPDEKKTGVIGGVLKSFTVIKIETPNQSSD